MMSIPVSDSYHSFCRAILLVVQSDCIFKGTVPRQYDAAPEKVVDFLWGLPQEQRIAFLGRNQRYFGGKGRITRMIERGPSHGLEGTFYRLADRWQLGTAFDSYIEVILGHPAYRQIVELGMPAVPLILRELQVDPDDDWLFVLKEIVGEDSPVIPQELEEKPQQKIDI